MSAPNNDQNTIFTFQKMITPSPHTVEDRQMKKMCTFSLLIENCQHVQEIKCYKWYNWQSPLDGVINVTVLQEELQYNSDED